MRIWHIDTWLFHNVYFMFTSFRRRPQFLFHPWLLTSMLINKFRENESEHIKNVYPFLFALGFHSNSVQRTISKLDELQWASFHLRNMNYSLCYPFYIIHLHTSLFMWKNWAFSIFSHSNFMQVNIIGIFSFTWFGSTRAIYTFAHPFSSMYYTRI